jgi:hypothetical protein
MYLHTAAQSGPIPVTLGQTAEGKWQIYRDGQPYYVKGVGGQTHLEEAKKIGANSIRTWSTDNAGEVLDAAHAQGLTVMLGLWAQHERHGFDYDNKEKVKTQLDYFTQIVTQYKDHPALLMWAVGNEVDLAYTNTNVWYAINDIAAMIHRIDPNHPTITVTAGLDEAEVRLIKERAPAIDVYGINTYSDIDRIEGKVAKYGWNGPYMITEWGPNGHWEVQKTAWDAPVEQSSKEKAQVYRDRYMHAIQTDSMQCVGSYVFLWGFKQETTSTWYGMFSDKGASSQAVDELETLWTGKLPANRAPVLDSAFLQAQMKGKNIKIKAGSRAEAITFVTDPDGDKISYHFEVVPESRDIRSGGDAESRPPALNGIGAKKRGNQFSFRAPEEEGGYRLFIYAFDGNDHYAYTNIPFYVTPRGADEDAPGFIRFKKQSMVSE